MKNCIAFLLFLNCQIAVFGQSGFQFETQKSRVAIPFQLINNLIFIPIEVNGIKLNFLLDSGVDETILLSLDDKEEVSFKSVQKIKLKGLGSNEAIEGLKSSNNTLSFKGLVDRNHDVYIVLDQSFNFSSHIGIPVNGIIGYNFFKNNIVEINYNKRKIFVYKNSDKLKNKLKKYASSPITIERNKPYLVANVELNNQEIPSKLLIDIGNSDAVWLFENKEKNITIPKVNFEDFLGKGFSGDINGFRAKISKIKMDNFEFNDPIVSFPDSISIKSVHKVKDRVGSIGGEILKRFNVIFDYPNQTVYLKKSHFYYDEFTYNRSGIELQNEGLQWVQETVNLQTVNLDSTYDSNGNKTSNDFKLKFTLKPIYSISSIRKNSPAADCGLKVGDLIVSIDNIEGYRYTLQSINNLFKSEDGKWLNFVIERDGKILKFRFQLKSVL